MKRLFLLSLVLLLINGCSESNDTIDEEVVVDPVLETFSITADDTTVKSLQIVTLTIPSSVVLTNQIYTAKFDDTEIALSRNELNKLSFITPDLPSKNYKFSIEINGKQSSLNFTLQAIENSEDVIAFIESEMLTPLKELSIIANSEMSDPNLSMEEKGVIEFGNEFYNKAIAGYASLTNEDKQLLRKYLIANEISIKGIMEESKSNKVSTFFDADEWYKNLDYLSKKLIVVQIQLVGIIGATTILLQFPEVTWTKLTALFLSAGGVYKFNELENTRTQLVEKSFHPFEIFIGQLFDKTKSNKMTEESFNFQNNISKKITINSEGRKLQKSDSENSNSTIASATTAVNKGDTLWNQFKESIDNVIAKIGSFFNITINKIQAAKGLPETSDVETIILDGKFFKIDEISSAITSQLTVEDENKMQLKFGTKNELPETFNAVLKYNDGVLKLETAITVNLLGNISLAGDLDFGEKLINSSTKKSFTITNQSNIPITITSIALPNGFVSNWTGGSIPTSGSKQVEITFKPIDTKDYSGTIIVKNNIDESDTTIGVTATGSKGLTLLGDLNFGEVVVNKELTKSLTLVNGTQSDIHVSSISLPSGYTVDWKSGTVGVSGSVVVYITFKPTQVKDYSGIISVSNDIDQINNKIAVSGSGVESNPFIGTWKGIKVNGRTLVYGEPYTEYIDGCSELIDFIDTIYSLSFTFGANDFNFSINDDYTSYNYSDLKIEDCSYSSFDIDTNTDPGGEPGSYIILNGNTLTVTYDEDGFVENWAYQFLDDNTLSISFLGDTVILERQ